MNTIFGISINATCIVVSIVFVSCTSLISETVGEHSHTSLISPNKQTLVTGLKTNANPHPLGLDDPTPRFSWRLESSSVGVMQYAWQLLIATDPELLRTGLPDIWDSGKVISAEPYALFKGSPLTSRTRYFWTVRVWPTDSSSNGTNEPNTTGWAHQAWFETALLDSADWQAKWIAGPERKLTLFTREEGEADDVRIRDAGEFCRPVNWPVEGIFPNNYPNPMGECQEVRPTPMLRNTFQVSGDVKQARVYTAGLAYNNLTINGSKVSDHLLDPSFTRYSKTVLYTTHDVTALLQQGGNTVATQLGSGQFDSSTQSLDFGWEHAEWRKEPRLKFQMHITYTDGREEAIVSDGSWRVSVDGPLRYDSFYLGETYDARQEIPNWDHPDFDASQWANVRVVEPPSGTLRAQMHEPIRVVRTLGAGTPTEPVPGIVVYDIGQNLAGWARIKVNAPKGTSIEIFYSEKLDEDGLLSDDVSFPLLGGQLQTDYYITKGSGIDTNKENEINPDKDYEYWTPRFTYKGFQYIQISAPGGKPLDENVIVEVVEIEQIRTDFNKTSRFESGSALLNQIHDNTKWAIESNAHGVLTDTPIYEKNAWTGDIQLIAGTAALMFDTERLYTKKFQDMMDSQTAEGEVSLLAPTNEHYGYVGKVWKSEECCGATPAWDAHWFITPWETYQRFGDLRVLEETYPGMKQYLDEWIPLWTVKYGDPEAHTLTSGLGDWSRPGRIPTNNALSATAYYAHLTWITSEIANELGYDADANRYKELFEMIKNDFNRQFLHTDGVYRETPESPYTQSAQILPLAFGLVPNDLTKSVMHRLLDDISNHRGGNPWVGILGARYLLPVLSDAGYIDAAFSIATQTSYPSWGYWIEELGWTAMGEGWEENTRSRNHYFLGAIVQWMYEQLAGIIPLEPGYASILFRPELPVGLDDVTASFESVRGEIGSSWHRTENGITYEVTIPPNSTAVVSVPTTSPDNVTVKARKESGFEPAIDVQLVSAPYNTERIEYKVRSGTYRFIIVL
ncbi:MAG: family 78 glycoside hydrolase catalytic domain [Balneolales bacterium]